MRAARARNGIAVFAIALTTILFTALFTIMMSIAYGYEQSTFRQIGSCSHGSFKNLTKEQYEKLRQDSLIREYGIRLYLGMPQEAPFHKSHVEISYMSANMAEWSFLEPAVGYVKLVQHKRSPGKFFLSGLLYYHIYLFSLTYSCLFLLASVSSLPLP